jgi:hypothetical protein
LIIKATQNRGKGNMNLTGGQVVMRNFLVNWNPNFFVTGKISEPYDNPFWMNEQRAKRERREREKINCSLAK